MNTTTRIRIDVSERELERDLTYGRRRGRALDEPLLDATIEQLAETGVRGTSIEAVARRVGMGKTTIYRRWPNREALIAAAVARFVDAQIVLPDTGTLHGDLRELAHETAALLQRPGLQAVAPELVAAANREHEWANALRARFVQPYQDAMAVLVDRAVARGEIDGATDAELVFDLLVGAIAYRAFITRAPLDEARIDALVDGVRAAVS